jgi:hypothetical protein
MCRFTKDPPGVLLEWSQFAPVLILLVAFVTAYYALILVNLFVDQPGREFRLTRRTVGLVTVISWLCLLVGGAIAATVIFPSDAALREWYTQQRGILDASCTDIIEHANSKATNWLLRIAVAPAALLWRSGLVFLGISQYGRGFRPGRGFLKI